MAFVTVLVHFTGGVSSPLVYLYFLLLVAGSVFGYKTIDYVLACQLTLFFLASCLLEALELIPHYSLAFIPDKLYYDFSHLSAATASLLLASLLITFTTSYLSERLREKQRRIEQLSTAQVDFLNAVMHEAKSPLTSIIGYVDLMEKKSLGPITNEEAKSLQIIKRQSQRILAMVNDLLSIARLESGHTKFDKRPANLQEIASRVIEELTPALAGKKLSLVKEFDSRTPVVSLDEDKMVEVLTNLLSNAVKFSNEGGRIFISISSLGQEALVSVRDEGVGIHPTDLPHIFERFYRASKESTERKGTGLGLALCRTIVEGHGGRLWAVSAGPGQGAVFHFTLPL
jgi:signal transduction histidine kinase